VEASIHFLYIWLGFKNHLTSAYHPQVTGLEERYHRLLMDILRARLVRTDWLSHLPYSISF
jgi:hypothetical protein